MTNVQPHSTGDQQDQKSREVKTEIGKNMEYPPYMQCEIDTGKRFPIQFIRDLSLSLINATTDELKKYNVPEEIISAIENCWILQSYIEVKASDNIQDFDYMWLTQEIPNMIQTLENLKGSFIEV